MSGTSQLPSGPTTTDDAIIIMIVPCSLTIGDVGARPEDVAGRDQQLGADGHRQQPAGEEEEEHPDRVLQADHLVVVR